MPTAPVPLAPPGDAGRQAEGVAFGPFGGHADGGTRAASITGAFVALVLLSHGSIEAHFHFFIIIGFIALYQDWVPFLLNVLFTVLTHGVTALAISAGKNGVTPPM